MVTDDLANRVNSLQSTLTGLESTVNEVRALLDTLVRALVPEENLANEVLDAPQSTDPERLRGLIRNAQEGRHGIVEVLTALDQTVGKGLEPVRYLQPAVTAQSVEPAVATVLNGLYASLKSPNWENSLTMGDEQAPTASAASQVGARRATST